MPTSADAPLTASSRLYEAPVLTFDPGTHTASIVRASIDVEGRWAMTASHDKTVRVWSAVTGELLRTIRLPAGPGHIGRPYAAAICPDGALIAVGGQTRSVTTDDREQIYLFDRESGSMLHRIEGLSGSALHLTFSPIGDRLAATSAGVGCVSLAAREVGTKRRATRITPIGAMAPPLRPTGGSRQRHPTE